MGDPRIAVLRDAFGGDFSNDWLKIVLAKLELAEVTALCGGTHLAFDTWLRTRPDLTNAGSARQLDEYADWKRSLAVDPHRQPVEARAVEAALDVMCQGWRSYSPHSQNRYRSEMALALAVADRVRSHRVVPPAIDAPPAEPRWTAEKDALLHILIQWVLWVAGSSPKIQELKAAYGDAFLDAGHE